jgi:hypothetical protein
MLPRLFSMLMLALVLCLLHTPTHAAGGGGGHGGTSGQLAIDPENADEPRYIQMDPLWIPVSDRKRPYDYVVVTARFYTAEKNFQRACEVVPEALEYVLLSLHQRPLRWQQVRSDRFMLREGSRMLKGIHQRLGQGLYDKLVLFGGIRRPNVISQNLSNLCK